MKTKVEAEVTATEVKTIEIIDFDILETYKNKTVAKNECKFFCNVKELKRALNILKSSISKSTVLPILDNILCEVSEVSVKLTTNNLENSIVYSLHSETKGVGKMLIPFATLNNYVSNISEGNLLISLDIANNTLIVNRDNSIFKIKCYQLDEEETFPEIPEVNNNLLKLPANLLLQGLKNTINFTASDVLRPVMNGICFECESKVMRFVSTDGHLLSCFTLKNMYDNYEYYQKENFCFILGQTGAKILQSVLKNETGLVKIYLTEKNIKVKYMNIEIILRLVEGAYPNWRHVVPSDNKNIAKINRKELISSLKRISTTANKSSNLIKLHLNGVCEVSGCDDDFEMSSIERVKDFSYNGSDLEIGFKSNFLLNVLNTIESEKVLIMLSNPNNAALIFPLEIERNSDLMILQCPMDLQPK